MFNSLYTEEKWGLRLMYVDMSITDIGLDEFPDRGDVGRKGHKVL